ncbi:MAG: hypothetical protein ACOC48_00090 [Thiohalospira sp.]
MEVLYADLIGSTDSPCLSQGEPNLMMMAGNPAHRVAKEGEELFHKE